MRKTTAWAEPSRAYSDIQQLFRVEKAGRQRIYQLRRADARSELWVFSSERTRPTKSRQLVTFEKDDDADAFIQEIRKELRVGGWSEV
jgi:hypothetical protein